MSLWFAFPRLSRGILCICNRIANAIKHMSLWWTILDATMSCCSDSTPLVWHCTLQILSDKRILALSNPEAYSIKSKLKMISPQQKQTICTFLSHQNLENLLRIWCLLYSSCWYPYIMLGNMNSLSPELYHFRGQQKTNPAQSNQSIHLINLWKYCEKMNKTWDGSTKSLSSEFRFTLPLP